MLSLLWTRTFILNKDKNNVNNPQWLNYTKEGIMRKTSIIGIIFILLIAVLFFTNPTQTQFRSYIQDGLKTELSKSTGANFLYGVFNALLPQQTEAVINSAVDSITERQDYLVFSIYKLNLPTMKLTYWKVHFG